MGAIEPADARIRPHPYETLLILRDTVYIGACEPVLYVIIGIAIFLGEGGIRQENKRADQRNKISLHKTL